MEKDNDSNPMHSIGHGRGDDAPVQRKTAAYSFVHPDRVVNVGEKRLDSVPEMKILTVKDVVSDLIEKDVAAWKALPKSVQNALMERPAEFQFIPPSEVSMVPNILYNGVVWRYAAKLHQGDPSFWVVHEIVR